MSNFKIRRANVEIFAEILEVCREPTTRTQIMHRANTSYLIMQKSVEHLRKLELLKIGDDAKKYVATEKGLEFIRRYAALQELLKLREKGK